jgi:hypothetical protein
MQHTRKIVAAATVLAILAATTAWLFRVPETRAVLIAPVNLIHH